MDKEGRRWILKCCQGLRQSQWEKHVTLLLRLGAKPRVPGGGWERGADCAGTSTLQMGNSNNSNEQHDHTQGESQTIFMVDQIRRMGHQAENGLTKVPKLFPKSC